MFNALIVIGKVMESG